LYVQVAPVVPLNFVCIIVVLQLVLNTAGLTGEKTIYRRRAEKEPEMGTPQTKPKRLKLVIDVSGSMYRSVDCVFIVWRTRWESTVTC